MTERRLSPLGREALTLVISSRIDQAMDANLAAAKILIKTKAPGSQEFIRADQIVERYKVRIARGLSLQSQQITPVDQIS